MKALLIEFDLRTGVRAGGINPKDPKLQCHGWQDLESKPAKEIRLVEDDRDLSKYEIVEGVTILDGVDEINAAIQAYIPSKYKVTDMTLMIEHAKSKGINLDRFIGMNPSQVAKEAFNQGLAGVSERKPELVE